MANIQQQNQIQKNCQDTIESITDFYNIKNRSDLITIILNPKLANKFFQSEKVMMFNIFDSEKKSKTSQQKIQHYAKKYSFQKLCQKFTKPKGTSDFLKSILQQKIKYSIIERHNTRKQIWMLASGAKYYMNSNKEMYKNLYEYTNYPQYYVKSIDLDLKRTVQDQNTTNKQQLQAMKRLLVSLSRRNPFIGYCQGLNFIANFILTMQFTEQQGFWLLSQLLQTLIPMDYYTNMIGVVSDQKIFTQVIKQRNKKIARKFEETGLDPSVFTIQWFVCLFTSSMPFYLVKILWDRLIIEGMTALLKAGIILIEEFQEQILNAQDFPDIILLIQKQSKKLSLSEQEFNNRFQEIYIHKEGLKLARDLYRQYHIKEKLAQKVNKKKYVNYLANIKCNLYWPICVHTLQKVKRQRQDINVWIMRQLNPPNLIQDYMDRSDLGNNNSRINFNTTIKNQIGKESLLVGRMVHVCDEVGYLQLLQNLKNNNVKLQQLTKTDEQSKDLAEKNEIESGNISKEEYIQQNEMLKSKLHENLDLILKISGQEQGYDKKKPYQSQIFNYTNKNEEQMQEEQKIQDKQIQKNGIKPQSVIQLQKSKIVHFYTKFMNDNKQLGQIIKSD